MSTPASANQWGPLPSGRHRLSRDEVLTSQRGRIILAMAAAVTEKGYGAVAVGDVVRRANVSRRTFYEHFEDKEACFLAMYDTAFEYVLSRTGDAVADLPDDDWPARLRVGMATYLEVLAADAEFAWALVIEALAAGPAAADRRTASLATYAESFSRLYATARRQDRSLPTLPDDVFVGVAGGVDELVRKTMRAQGAAALPNSLEVIMRFLEAGLFASPGRPVRKR